MRWLFFDAFVSRWGHGTVVVVGGGIGVIFGFTASKLFLG